MVKISFPGLGIDTFSIDPVAFTIPLFGGLEVRWYGLIITLGIILAFSYCAFRSKQEGIKFDDLLDFAIFTVIFGVIGARTFYVLTSLKDGNYKTFKDVIAIWEGGLAIYGAIIAGAITIYFVSRHKKINPLKMFDSVAPAVMIGQILGRWGNFCNGEAYGGAVSEDSLFYFIRMGINPHNIKGISRYDMAFVHPTFLYESLWNLVGFLIINALYKKKKFDGQIVLMYITWYGFGRMLIEGLRTDSLYIGVFRISQVIGFLCFVIGSVLLTIFLLRARRAKLTSMEYTPAYAKISHLDSTQDNTVKPEENTEEKFEETDTSDDTQSTKSNEDKKETLNNLFEENK